MGRGEFVMDFLRIDISEIKSWSGRGKEIMGKIMPFTFAICLTQEHTDLL